MKISAKDKIVSTKSKNINFKIKYIQETEMKPMGLWYGIGTSWIDWCVSEMPEWIQNRNIFKIKINPEYILKITNEKEFIKFENKYMEMTPDMAKFKHNSAILKSESINWGKVASEYNGIEISPYLWKFRHSSLWYYISLHSL